jgi:hypothetical protein
MKKWNEILFENFSMKSVQNMADKLHNRAVDGKLKYGGRTYLFVYNRKEQHYDVYDEKTGEDAEFTRINTRKVTQAKKWFKEYMES